MPAKTAKKPKQIPSSLGALRANMTKRYGEGRILVREDVTDYTVTSTGSLSLDLALRVSGWVQGRIHEIMGPEGVSKSTLCATSGREMQKAQPGRAVGYIDMEQTFDWPWAERQGLLTDDKHFLYALPDNSEDVADQAAEMLETGLISMLIVDSIGGMESKQAFDKDAGDVVMGRNAQVITRLSKRLAVLAQRNKTTVLLVNQPRANISNPMGMDESAGPKAMKHSTTTKVRLSRTGEKPMKVQFDGESEPDIVGTQFRARVERNKVAAAGKAAEYWLINQDTEEYGPVGISQAHETMDIGTYLNIIRQEGGGRYRFPWTESDKDRIWGKEKVLEFLRENPERMLQVRDLAVKAMRGDVIPEASGHVIDTTTGEVLA